MIRPVFLGVLLLATACGNEQTNRRTVKTLESDTLRRPAAESFDLRVKKYEDPKRQNWQDPKFVIEALGDLNDKSIADIGSGTGYFTFQLAVPAKKVIAIDIEQRFLNYIEDRKTEMYDRSLAEKIETRLARPNDPTLESNEVDIVLVVNTISYIKNRDKYLRKVYNGLSTLGTIVVVDYELGNMPVGPGESLKVHEDQIVKELQSAGFMVESVDTVSLQYQYLIKAQKVE